MLIHPLAMNLSLGNGDGALELLSLAAAIASGLLLGFNFCGGCDCCDLAVADFNQPDGAGIGGNLEVVAGTFAISGNRLVTSSANALLLHRAQFPKADAFTTDTSGYVEVTVDSSTAGAQALVVGGYHDANNYLFARWEFGASEGKLTLWTRFAGVSTQRRGEYVFAGRGAGVATTIHLCWGSTTLGGEQRGFGVAIPEIGFTAEGWGPGGGSWGPIGVRGGVGTQTTGGNVFFENYSAGKDRTQLAGCNDCQRCGYCPDDTKICVTVGGLPHPAHNEAFHGPNVIDRSGGFGSLDANCTWQYFPSPYLGSPLFLIAWIELDAGHYYLWVNVGVNAEQAGLYRLDLGTTPPNCAEWDHLIVPFHSLADPDEPDEGLPDATVIVTSGEECYYYHPDDCCDDVDLSLQPTLNFTVTKNGSPFFASTIDLLSQSESGFTYESDGGLESILCARPPAFPQPLFARFNDGPEEIFCLLDSLSCDPFHAEGTVVHGGHTYYVEITA